MYKNTRCLSRLECSVNDIEPGQQALVTTTVEYNFVSILRRFTFSPEDYSILSLPVIESPPTIFTHQVPMLNGSLSDKECARKSELRFLERMGIAVKNGEKIVRRVSKHSKKVISEVLKGDINNGVRILFRVNLTAVTWELLEYDVYEEESIRIAEMESMEDEAKLIPASRSSIDELDKVVVDNSECSCTICMDQIEVGDEAIQMPCSHCYHQDCIVKWLQNSHLCPLSRYEMPIELKQEEE